MRLAAPRYTRRDFPAYWFLPGRRLPHPLRDPAGHSYAAPGAQAPVVDWRPAEAWRDCTEYLFACDLYNHGYWWEAHEHWEGLWHKSRKDGPQGCFLQGLIQAAAAHIKIETQMIRGARSLRRSCEKRLGMALADVAGPRFMGLHVPDFATELFAYLDHACEPGTERMRHDPETYPYIRLSGEEG